MAFNSKLCLAVSSKESSSFYLEAMKFKTSGFFTCALVIKLSPPHLPDEHLEAPPIFLLRFLYECFVLTV